MGFRDVIGSTRPFVVFRCALFGVAVFTLAGCGSSEDVGALLVDPGRYSAYHCNELAARWKVLIAREKELRGLMDKASESGGGAVVGAIAYRADYDSVLSEEKLLKRNAAEKNCSFTPEFQSDQSIH
jgi:uncharacterized membrane protein YebE (DUF533 family)